MTDKINGLVEAEARRLFAVRWPGKSWDGHGVSRSYWRRKARDAAALSRPQQPSEIDREAVARIIDVHILCICSDGNVDPRRVSGPLADAILTLFNSPRDLT